MKTIANVRVGKPDTAPDTPSHTPGVREGNEPGGIEQQAGIHPAANNTATATPERSTGINPKHRNPIDPRMPILTPA